MQVGASVLQPTLIALLHFPVTAHCVLFFFNFVDMGTSLQKQV